MGALLEQLTREGLALLREQGAGNVCGRWWREKGVWVWEAMQTITFADLGALSRREYRELQELVEERYNRFWNTVGEYCRSIEGMPEAEQPDADEIAAHLDALKEDVLSAVAEDRAGYVYEHGAWDFSMVAAVGAEELAVARQRAMEMLGEEIGMKLGEYADVLADEYGLRGNDVDELGDAADDARLSLTRGVIQLAVGRVKRRILWGMDDPGAMGAVLADRARGDAQLQTAIEQKRAELEGVAHRLSRENGQF